MTGHEHVWIEITSSGDWERRFVCLGCGEGKSEPR